MKTFNLNNGVPKNFKKHPNLKKNSVIPKQLT